jgi:3-isopropylmalate/(R)-2-methylmalate dehydratase small subunit
MSADSRIARISGRAIVLRGDDIDTDRIMPARFLKAITFEGLEAHVFEDDRRAARAAGLVHPFDDPASQGATVLVVNANFGCGSSREHAPQGLVRRGLRAIVGESFAEIFQSNAIGIGLACFQASSADVAALMARLERDRMCPIDADVAERAVAAGDLRIRASVTDAARQMFLTGEWDAPGLLVADYDEVARVARALPYVRGF